MIRTVARPPELDKLRLPQPALDHITKEMVNSARARIGPNTIGIFSAGTRTNSVVVWNVTGSGLARIKSEFDAIQVPKQIDIFETFVRQIIPAIELLETGSALIVPGANDQFSIDFCQIRLPAKGDVDLAVAHGSFGIDPFAIRVSRIFRTGRNGWIPEGIIGGGIVSLGSEGFAPGQSCVISSRLFSSIITDLPRTTEEAVYFLLNYRSSRPTVEAIKKLLEFDEMGRESGFRPVLLVGFPSNDGIVLSAWRPVESPDRERLDSVRTTVLETVAKRTRIDGTPPFSFPKNFITAFFKEWETQFVKARIDGEVVRQVTIVDENGSEIYAFAKDALLRMV